jgi:hypothetical protein
MTSKVQAASKAHGQHKGKQPDGEDKIKNDDGTRVGGRNASKEGVGTPIWGRNKRLRGKQGQAHFGNFKEQPRSSFTGPHKQEQ